MNPLGLSDSEVLIVWAWATGRDSRWISSFTGRTLITVRVYEKRLRAKLGARGNSNAVAIVLREILNPEPLDRRTMISQQQLAHGARMAVRAGVDPVLALSYVMWPPESLKVAA